MKYLSFVLIFIAFIYVANAARTKDAWPKEFNVTKLSTWPRMKKYFATAPKNDSEDRINVLIQRKVVGVRFANGTQWLNASILYRPVTVFIVDPKRYVRGLGIGYAILSFLATAVCVYFGGRGMWKSATTVHVKDLHDVNKPPRECPVTLTLFMNAKREAKPTVVKSAPERKGSQQSNNKKTK